MKTEIALHKSFMIVLVSCIASQIIFAVVPPVNYWGSARIDNNYVQDGTEIIILVNNETAVKGIALKNMGYYDLKVPMDDPLTPEVEGYRYGDPVIFLIEGKEVTYPKNERLAYSGLSIMKNLYYNSDGSEPATDAQNSDITDAAGGGSPAIEGYAIPIPPVAFWGNVLINGHFAIPGTELEIWADCFGQGSEIMLTAKTEQEVGYFEFEIPMDYPSTTSDEGCVEGQKIEIRINGEKVKYPLNGELVIPSSGSVKRIDISIGSEQPPNLEKPNAIKELTENKNKEGGIESPELVEKKSSNTNAVLFFILLFFLLVTYYITKRKKNRKGGQVN